MGLRHLLVGVLLLLLLLVEVVVVIGVVLHLECGKAILEKVKVLLK
jgi:hypothetical protein